MYRFRPALFALLLLSACGGSPWVEDDGGTDGGTDTGGIDSDGTLPPGTTSPSADKKIVRYEAKDTETGSGYVTNVGYDAASDTFTVQGLAFDGDNAYVRGTKVGSLGNVAVYEGKPEEPDDFTGSPVTQLQHRALYGVSKNGQVEFAIVRTGGYIDYGFGGFIYQRNGGVTLPEEGEGRDVARGQAHYKGEMTSLRDFEGRPGLEYGRADMTMDIDFDDFNDGNAVKGRVFNRRIYDIDGNDITADIVAAVEEDADLAQDGLPVIVFDISENVMSDHGEIAGTVQSNYYTGTGAVEGFEAGNYYAIVSGSNAQTVVGMIVVEGDDPRWDGVTTRETGGFILTRK